MKLGLICCFLALTLPAAETNELRTVTATVTAYCPCKACCGKWARSRNPRREILRADVSVAASRQFPLGTRVWIEGLGERIVQDRPARHYDNRFDIYFTNHVQAVSFGIRRLEIKILSKTPG